MQFNATGKSPAGFAAMVACAVLLVGCGGSGSGSSSGSTSGSSSGQSAGVEATQTGASSVSLSWVAPGQRINGDAISFYDIDGYIVRYGRDPADLDQQATVDCEVLNCSYAVNGLGAGTWYFAVQTVDSNGLISSPSQPVSRSI